MSTIKIRFSIDALDGGQEDQGVVNVTYNDGSQVHILTLRLITGPSARGFFTEVLWSSNPGNQAELDNQQAKNYAGAFNRDYAFVGVELTGGLVKANLNATVVGGDVTISSQVGQFIGAEYTGDRLVFQQVEIVNVDDIDSPELSAINSDSGNCDTIDYTFSTSQGQPPYTLKLGSSTTGANVITAWDGGDRTLSLNRGALASYTVVDSAGNYDTVNVLVPRKLAIGEFNEILSPNLNGSFDVTIENTNLVKGTTPIEYSLDEENAQQGGNYQASNSFPGILEGTYKIFIKDKYGCEINKTIVLVSGSEETAEPLVERYFDFPHANSLIVTEVLDFDSETKPNFFNTRSTNEAVGIAYKCRQKFVSTDVIRCQFKSSYPFHNITLHSCDGSMKNITPIQVQKNIGFQERVDCALFPTEDNLTGVYFDGGSSYFPDTSTVIGPSEHTEFLPDWVEIGRLVDIESLGTFSIIDIGYDPDLDRGFFTINASIQNQKNDIVQVKYNLHGYNLYECFLNVSDINSGKGILVFEKGYDIDKLDGNPWASEEIVVIEDDKDHILFKWKNSYNVADLVFVSGYEGVNRIEGRLRPIFDGNSEGYDGDNNYFSTKEELYLRNRFVAEFLTSKQVYKLCIVTALDGFSANGLPCRRNKTPEITEIGDTNLFKFSCDLAMTGNILGEQRNEIVLNPTTGNEDGGSYADLPEAPVYDSKIRLNIENSGFVTVDGKFINIE